MIKVFQKFVDPQKGDCMQAVIASLLEIPYDETPRFIEHPNWFQPLYNLIDNKGLKWKGHLFNRLSPEDEIEERLFIGQLSNYDGIDGFFWASVFSPKYGEPTTHAVIIDKNFNIVHDPNPEYKDLAEYPRAKEIGYNGIVYVSLIE